MSDLRVLKGTIVEILNGCQRVDTDSERQHLKTLWLCSVDMVRGGQVGDRVVLEYRATPSLGLWYGKKDPNPGP